MEIRIEQSLYQIIIINNKDINMSILNIFYISRIKYNTYFLFINFSLN
jgi:hypothetical protein